MASSGGLKALLHLGIPLVKTLLSREKCFKETTKSLILGYYFTLDKSIRREVYHYPQTQTHTLKNTW